jgi:hypothetical protein
MVSFVRFKEICMKRIRPSCPLLAIILGEPDEMPRWQAIVTANLYIRQVEALPESELNPTS